MNDSEDIRYRTFPSNEDEDVKGNQSSNLRNNGDTTHNSDESQPYRESFEPSSMREDRLDLHDDDDTTPIIQTEPQYTGSFSFFCDPQSICHKGIALALMCSVGFGSYFCYDNPGALQVSGIMSLTLCLKFSYNFCDYLFH